MMTTLTEEMFDTWTDGETRAIHDEMMNDSPNRFTGAVRGRYRQVRRRYRGRG